jgi:hypothetical protein
MAAASMDGMCEGAGDSGSPRRRLPLSFKEREK